MKHDRAYPLALVASLAICAAIATAFVGSTHHQSDAPRPVSSAVSTTPQR